MDSMQNNNQKISLKVVSKKLLVIFFVVLGFFLLAAFFIALLRLAQKGFSLQVFHEALVFAHKLILNPFYLWDVYVDWGEKLCSSWHKDKLSTTQFIPILMPISLIVFFIWKTFPLYKRLKENIKQVDFSNQQKLLEKGLPFGRFSVLGSADEMLLQMPENQSLLALGNESRGKTSAICIPTVLKADDCCIVAVSSQNELAEYTSGYRATLGPVFYFNWGLSDAPLKNEYYPRWNPLSVKEMPPKGELRDNYLKGLSRYFILHNAKTEILEDDYWPQLAGRAFLGLLSFFVSKIERAAANDYFLGVLLDKGRLSQDDKRLLLSYYVIMDKEYAHSAIENLESATLSKDNYLPVGSWEGVPHVWQGKELCLSMFADWLLQSFLMVKSQEKNTADTWKIVLEYCLQEAEFFGYDDTVTEILQQLFYLSSKQRSVIFPMLFNPLSVFRISSVRERTSTSDFAMSQLRTTYAEKVQTFYCVAGDKNVNFINKLFVDMALHHILLHPQRDEDRPLLWIFDNLEQQPEYKSLTKALNEAEKHNMSLVLTADSLANLQLKYSQNAMENIVNKTQYKVLLAENFSAAAAELQKMANGGVVFTSAKNFSPASIADATYYRKVAKHLSAIKKTLLKQGDEILFLPSFYRMPFKIRSAYFLAFESLKRKATLDTAYFIDDDLLHRRNVQDMETPDLLEVLKVTGCKLENVEDIDIFLKNRYDEAVETIEQVADKESVLADDISTRWQNNKEPVIDENKDWWLSEDAFDFSDVKENANPFQKK